MTRIILPIILIGIAVGTFLMFTTPIYQDIPVLRAEVDSYNEALSNSKALENERDKLTSKYNSIDKENLAKLEKLVPDNIDNIRLILEIEKVAQPYGMVLKDVKYNTEEVETGAVIGGGPSGNQAARLAMQRDYRVLDMEFSVSGTYDKFLDFTKDLERNLRIIDIVAVTFSSEVDPKVNPSGVYKYNFKIKTYWLKN
jgi:Tfp pilus assembly protein PilO